MQKKSRHTHKYKLKRSFIIIFSIILVIMIFLFKDASFLLRSTSTIVFLVLFYIFDHFFDIRFKTEHYAFAILMVVTSWLLSPLYYLYPNYDKIQHFIIPMLIFIIIFYTISKLKLELKWKLTFSFFTVVGMLGLFELSEYGLDLLFDLKLQGVYIRDIQGVDKLNLITDRIDDTMVDFFIGVIGTSLVSIYYWFTLKNKKSIKVNT